MVLDDVPAPAPGGAPDTSALFAELNRGGAVTAGLKKVDKSQMTHKNPELRKTGAVPAKDKPASSSKPKYGAATDVDKPSKTALEGNKWVVEFHKDNPNIVIADTEIKQSVYIYKCVKSTIVVKGKINQVTLDSCTKCGVVVDSVVSSTESINCKSVQVQITGKCPTMNVEKTDGIQLYLSRENMDLEFTNSKSSEMNISYPGKTDEDDFVEVSIPEQYKSVFTNGKWETNTVEHKA
eukprot:NODE_1366_length_889_cov_84.564304_g1320_i0.p1 GENE.NODE_1366_length_889_cov_84.564304_g1320_i0~~NODE_1366_length_889_cov_84.564304_g1320_i0.p1  ORF type:complete len:237 (+),score=62.16 NODE_1366_length_889_cov_84.564304_g1320_i0:128-838(+)